MAKVQYSEDERLYIQMMQSNIERMANNCANCKTWLVTLLAGLMAITCGITELHWWLLLALLPTIMFWYLDGKYLSLERKMRNRQRDFLNRKISESQSGETSSENDDYNMALFNFEPLEKKDDDKELGFKKTTRQCWSSSVWPFYLILMIAIIIVTLAINKFSLPCQ